MVAVPAVVNISAVRSIGVGYNHGCGVEANGKLKCWGYNAYGQLGDDSKATSFLASETVELAGVVAVTGGGYHSCAVRGDGSVYCWGYNADSQLGDMTTGQRTKPKWVYRTNDAPFGESTCKVAADCAEDGAACTVGVCTAGACKHVAAPDGVGCDDGRACTAVGSCSKASCSAGKAIACDDKNKCTTDRCAPATGACQHLPIKGCK